MEKKYHYQQGFCKLLHLNGLWEVTYIGKHGEYKKDCMSCTCAVDNCKDMCNVIDNAPDIFPVELEWKLKDTPLGE